MIQEEMLEYNKRCAEFLYPKAKEEYELGEISLEDGIFKKAMLVFGHFHMMKFHSDWNWIMEVVEAIEKLYDHPNKEINVDIKAGQIEIFQRPYKLENNDYHEIIYLGDGYINGSKKEAVVHAINQFLIWYNENKTN